MYSKEELEKGAFKINLKDNEQTIELLNEGGLFGSASLTLLYGLNQYYPSMNRVNIEWNLHSCLKDELESNAYSLYFETVKDLPLFKSFKTFNFNYVKYDELEFDKINLFVKSFFKPKQEIIELKEKIKKKYKISPDKTIVLYYRGTDKWTEVPPLDPKLFVKEVKKILEKEPELKVWVQTDDLISFIQIENELKKVIKINELPMNAGNVSVHLMDSKKRRISNVEFNETFLAITLLMSECKYIVTGCGNVSLWSVLFRGNAKGVIELLPLIYSINIDFTKRFYEGGFREQDCEIMRGN